MKQKSAFLLSGLFILSAMTGCGAQAKQTTYISEDKARAAAMEAAGISEGSADRIAATLSKQNDIPYYEIDITADGVEYSFDIDAVTGVVIESNKEISSESQKNPKEKDLNITDFDTASNHTPAPSTSPEAGKELTLEQAKQAALDHAGKTSAEVTFIKELKEFDDGQWVYEIEFLTQSANRYQEYDYEISASTGKVLNVDYDAESYTPNNTESAAKTEDEVRRIALAKVPGASASDCSLWLDEDDGRLLYEGKILYNGMEYEFEIDAYSGTILDWEAESIHD